MQVNTITHSKTVQVFEDGMKDFYSNYPETKAFLATSHATGAKVSIPILKRRIFKTRDNTQSRPSIDPHGQSEPHVQPVKKDQGVSEDKLFHMTSAQGEHVFSWRGKVLILSEEDATEEKVKQIFGYTFEEFHKATDIVNTPPQPQEKTGAPSAHKENGDMQQAYKEATTTFNNPNDPLQEDAMFGRDRKQRRQMRSKKRNQNP